MLTYCCCATGCGWNESCGCGGAGSCGSILTGEKAPPLKLLLSILKEFCFWCWNGDAAEEDLTLNVRLFELIHGSLEIVWATWVISGSFKFILRIAQEACMCVYVFFF